MKQGEHTFPFKFLIPASAPTSFEGNYGRIIYRVRAFIDTPRFSKDYSTEKYFYLLSLLNLNEVPDIWGPCSSAVTQQFTYMLMKTGTVVMKAQTDMKGYTPGQVIQVTVSIYNQSGKNTGNMGASLMQRVTYETKRPTYDLRMIADVEGGVVKAGKEAEWKEQIIVPALPQSSLAGCDLIKIEYYVKVCLKSPDVMLTLPIHIGNVSLDKKRHPSKKAHLSFSDCAENTAACVFPPDNATSATTPPLTSRSTPKPAPRSAPRSRMSSLISPSAPPADYPKEHGGSTTDGSFPSKRQSQLVSPSAFSYAPGLSFTQTQKDSGPVRQASAPYPADNSCSSIPAPHAMPQEYVSGYPQDAPPSYDESCNA
ncbi:arrestin domain-containing protein 1a isoform X2 [Betta splendens]|nr:arrestin domain-containing protein 1a isoform X2 [Betta splendens]XP_029017967.1 arrestin domain-containing protein 1a isoform X2 [Betta splendens]